MAEGVRDGRISFFDVQQSAKCFATDCNSLKPSATFGWSSGFRQQFETLCNIQALKNLSGGSQKCVVEHKGLSDVLVDCVDLVTHCRSCHASDAHANRLTFVPRSNCSAKIRPAGPPPFPL